MNLNDKPWEAAVDQIPQSIYAPKGMVGPEERRSYYWLAKNVLSGLGCIVDAGAFVGSSTYCFAAGAAAGGRRDFNGEKLIHAFDYFKVIDEYVGKAISRDFRSIGEGESYLDIFEAQTKDYADLIQSYPGDFLSHKWIGLPIEILFIDVAKTQKLNSHAVAEFFPHLIPEHSVVIHQDYYHCWHPYIHISMEFFADEFELLDEHIPHQSCLWRLNKPIPKEKIARIVNYDLSASERLALLDRLHEKSSPILRPMITVVKTWQLYLDGAYADAEELLKKMRSEYQLEDVQALWAIQALKVEQHMKAID